jgi:hypothetical protein
MSRFHNKWHRHNHHTDNTGHTSEPDAMHDPIASESDPFIGDFHIEGDIVADGGSGGLFTSLSGADLSATTMTFEDAAVTFSSLASTGAFLSIVVNGSAVYVPLYQ